MPDRGASIPILKTKLYQPTVTKDMVLRKSLLKKLDTVQQVPLLLMAAPAGYGKSTLASQWLDNKKDRTAWVSLEKTDNDLRVFLSYVVAAIQSIQSEACAKTAAVLRSRSLPAAPQLASVLNADLDRLEGPIRLVLDDYHTISESEIHEVMTFQLKHTPAHFQLVILTRRDPPFPLSSLAARNRMQDIRLSDLMFSEADTKRFLEKTYGKTIEPEPLKMLHDALDGWPVGLRLVSVALKQSSDPDQLIKGMPNGHPRIQAYLLEEVLAELDPVHRSCISRLSILDRYCESLNQALCNTECSDCAGLSCMFSSSSAAGGNEIWAPLSIPLDTEGIWFRYHHQFQQLLQTLIKELHAPEEIAILYQRASVWMEENGHIDDAIRYALEVSEQDAIAIIERHRHQAMNAEQWVRIRHWLDMIPPEVAEKSLELLLLQSWCAIGYPEMFVYLAQAETILNEQEEAGQNRELRGELLSYKALRFLVAGDTEATAQTALDAIDLLGSNQLSERGFAYILLAMGRQMQGRFSEGRDLMLQVMQDRSIQQTTLHARLLSALCFTYWIEADALQLMDVSKEYFNVGQQCNLSESRDHGLNFIGLCHYAYNELDEAIEQWTQLVDNAEISNLYNYLQAAYALAMAHHWKGHEMKARELCEHAVSLAYQTRSPSVLMEAKAFEAELALRNGRLMEAGKWAEHFSADKLPPSLLRFYVPHFTQIRVLIALRQPDTLDEALGLCAAFRTLTDKTKNRHFLITSLILNALALDGLGRGDEALLLLAEALNLTLPGGDIRLFIDEGPGVAKLLNQLELEGEALYYAGRILAGFKSQADETTLDARTELLDPLSVREREVLLLMARQLGNREIADKLFIAPGTVKRHTNSIYSKLAIHSRKGAVEKARGLGLLDA